MSIENLVIRLATEDDMQTILGIYNFYIANSTALWDYECISVQELQERIPIRDGKYNTFLICLGSEVAGFCSLKQYQKKESYNRTAEIGVYLKEEFTGLGIGERAVRFLEQTAAEGNIKVLIASISSENTASIKLVKKMGYRKCAHFKEVGEKFGRILDGIYFQKTL